MEQNEIERDLEKMCKEKFHQLESGSAQLETHLTDMEHMVEMTEEVLDSGQYAQVEKSEKES